MPQICVPFGGGGGAVRISKEKREIAEIWILTDVNSQETTKDPEVEGSRR